MRGDPRSVLSPRLDGLDGAERLEEFIDRWKGDVVEPVNERRCVESGHGCGEFMLHRLVGERGQLWAHDESGRQRIARCPRGGTGTPSLSRARPHGTFDRRRLRRHEPDGGGDNRPEGGRIAGEPADRVEGRGQRKETTAVDRAVGRSQTPQSLIRGGDAYRPTRVGSQPDVSLPQSDGGGRAVRRSAGDAPGYSRVQRRAVVRVAAGNAVRELVRAGDPRDVGALSQKSRDSRGVSHGWRREGEKLRNARAQRETFDVEQVFHCHPEARQGQDTCVSTTGSTSD